MTDRSAFILGVNKQSLAAAYTRLVSGVEPHYGPAIEDPDSGCLLCQAAPNKSGLTRKLRMSVGSTINTIEVPKGYPRVKLEGKMVYAHHISYMAANEAMRSNTIFTRDWLDSSLEVSHLCGNPKCVKANHLLLEPEALNKHRDSCHATAFLTTCPSCAAIIDNCPHVPRCIKKLTTAVMSRQAVLVRPPPAPPLPPLEEEEVPSASQSIMDQQLTQGQEAAVVVLSQAYKPAQMETLKVTSTAAELEALAAAYMEGNSLEVMEDYGQPEEDEAAPDVGSPEVPSATIVVPQADAWRVRKAGPYVSGLKRTKRH